MAHVADPYRRLIAAATAASKLLGDYDGVEAVRTELLAAISDLESQLSRVLNSGGRLELHPFPERPVTPLEELFYRAAKQYADDGQMEIEDTPYVSVSPDGGAHVMAWWWVSDAEVEYPRPYTAGIYYKDEQGQEHLIAHDECIAFDLDHAERLLVEKHWDERLTAAGCIPVVHFGPDQLHRYAFYGPDDPKYPAGQPYAEEVFARTPEEALSLVQMRYPEATMEWLDPSTLEP